MVFSIFIKIVIFKIFPKIWKNWLIRIDQYETLILYINSLVRLSMTGVLEGFRLSVMGVLEGFGFRLVANRNEVSK